MLSLFLLWLILTAFGAWLFVSAPYGWQDSDGFHAGEHPSDSLTDSHAPCPTPAEASAGSVEGDGDLILVGGSGCHELGDTL